MESYQFDYQVFVPEPVIIDPKEDFLRRTIEVKNKNIDELLKELKETQELYQTYKTSYIAEEQKLKSKVAQLTDALTAQGSELERQRQLSTKLKGDLQALIDREQKMIENHMAQSKEQHALRRELEDKCRELMRQNSDLKSRNQGLANRYVILQERCQNSERTAASYREQLRLARQQIQDNKLRWLQEKKELTDRLQLQELRKQGKQKVNRKLDALEQKILQTMRKI